MHEIIYRPLRVADAKDIAVVLGDVWHTDVEGEVRQLHGLIDLAIYAQQPTWSQVAEMDGRAVGVVMARAGKSSDEEVAPWRTIEQETWSRLREMPNGKADELQAYFDDSAKIDSELLVESGCDPNYELVLFAVSEETRGRGVGGALLGAAQEYLREQGATHAFIYTDTDCNWQYYEHRGMKRKAQRVLELEPGADPADDPVVDLAAEPFRMFVYEMEL